MGCILAIGWVSKLAHAKPIQALSEPFHTFIRLQFPLIRQSSELFADAMTCMSSMRTVRLLFQRPSGTSVCLSIDRRSCLDRYNTGQLNTQSLKARKRLRKQSMQVSSR